MSNYNSTLQSNNIDLQAILNQINELPEASGEQATPIISVNASGLITATAGSKSSTHQLAFQAAKTITPSTASQIAVSGGYYTGGNITVAAVPTQSKSVTPTSSAQNIIPDSGKFLSRVTVAGDSNLVAENIVSGKTIFGVTGTASTGSTGGFPNGTVWTRSNLTSEIGHKARNENGIWVANVYRHGFYYSIDGKTWIQSNVRSGITGSIFYGNKTWVNSCGGYVYYSTDGKTWIKATGISNSIINFGDYGNGLFVVAQTFFSGSNGIYYSADGKIWNHVSIEGTVEDIIFVDGNWFAIVTSTNPIITHIYQSTDGKAWAEISSISNRKMSYLSYLDGLFIVTDAANTSPVYYSTDGKIWTQSNISARAGKPIYGKGIYVLVTQDKGIYYSTNGKTWYASNLSSGKCLEANYSNGVWVADNDGKIYYSTDGKIWTESNISSNTTNYCQFITNANGIWVLGTWEDGIYYSVTWEP